MPVEDLKSSPALESLFMFRNISSNHEFESFPTTLKSGHVQSFGELPIELLIEIFRLAGSQSQANYRALLLTSRTICHFVRADCIPFLPIVISRKSQAESFYNWLCQYVALACQVKYLWVIPDTQSPIVVGIGLGINVETLTILINCPNLLFLACEIRYVQYWAKLCILSREVTSLPFPRTLQIPSSLKHLTVMFNAPWGYFEEVCELFSQIQTLHVIGCSITNVEFPSSILLHQNFTNLTEASFSFPGSTLPNFDSGLPAWSNIIQSPKLAKVAFTIRIKPGPDSKMVPSEVQHLLGPRFTLFYRPKRWTEMKIWKESISDLGCIWKLPQHDLMEIYRS